METASFLSEFPPVRTEEWERIIRETVNGAEYASKLIWHPEEGLAIKPYYRAEDLAGLHFLDAAPGEFPYARGTRPDGEWRVREEVDVVDPEEANRAARDAVAAGAEEIAFRNTKIGSVSDVALVLANLSEIPVHFAGLSQESIRIVIERLSGRPHGISVTADIDPLADLDFSAELLRNELPGFKPFAIHGDEFQEHAAGAIEEVGFAISAAVDFLDEMLERGGDLRRITRSLGFSFAIGPEFFIQIAKLRAFRMAWAKVVESFGGDHQTTKAVIHARTSRWNETIYDPHVNILRATTEAISAVLGGADSISVAAFDECYKQPGESSRRLARYTQLILKQEALLARVADPVGGSYLIESVTNAIATKAWKLFQELEAAGGYRKASAEGIIPSVLNHRTLLRDTAVAHRRLVLTGTNRFANTSERAMDRLEQGMFEQRVRPAQAFEKLRLRIERAELRGQLPRILLAEIGDAKMRGARSQFAADFLACAGLRSQTQRFASANEIAETDADLIVLCSSDAEYLAIAEELMPQLERRGGHACILIAGNPATAEQLTKLGISDFIHLRSNAVEVLARVMDQIGIEG